MRQPADIFNAYLRIHQKWAEQGVSIMHPEDLPSPPDRRICPMCNGSKTITLSGTQHVCLGCRGFGYVFVHQVVNLPVEKSPLPTPRVARHHLRLRASSDGLTQRIIQAIVDHQHEYFETFDLLKIRPMVQRQIAEVVGCEIPTVCVRLNGLEHDGIVLRKLFSESVNGVASIVIKERIRQILEQRAVSSPTIVKLLAGEGITVSRRTVNKYRKTLKL